MVSQKALYPQLVVALSFGSELLLSQNPLTLADGLSFERWW